MKLNKKLFGRSLYKIATILFLVGYNFAPAVFAIGDISKLEGDRNQSVSVTTEETSEVLNEVPVDTSEDIHEKGISDPASIAEGEELPSKEALPFRTDVLQKAVLNSRGQYTISSTSGIWTGVTPSGVASGLNTNIIRWGNSTGDGQSGLKFTSAGSQSFSPNDVFLIGDLTHMNWPVSGDVPNSATLKVTLNFTNPLLTPSPTFSYGFNIKETPNTYILSNCVGYNTDEQLSRTPCDDVITFPNAYGDKVFTIDDTKYTLKIDGFQNAYPEGSSVSKFVTEERKNNKAYLVGHLSSVLIEKPAISIVKKVNGEDANTAPGIYIGQGDPVAFEYVVQNTGNVRLTNITVTDDKGVNVSCPEKSLEAGASMTCTSTGTYTAILGLYTNIGKVVGTHLGGTVTDTDPANYTGVKKVDICHATGSHGNPYADAKASMTADAGGHDGHNGPVWYPGITVTWGDIIPPFDYSGGHYPGKNWDAYGQSVLANGCTVPTGTLKVNKVAIPSTDTTSFNITGTGTPAASGAPTFHNGNTGTISHGNPHTYTVSPGTYSVSETVPTGWKEVGNTCNDIVIAKGETKECTITNTKYGSITIVKDASPSSDQVFSFTTTGTGLSDFTLVDNSDDSNPSKVFTDLLPGTYSVTENSAEGWDLTSATCIDGSPVSAINLSAGENVTCTFVNEKRGSISGHKYYDEDGKAETTNDRHPVSGWTIFIDANNNEVLDDGEASKITGADGKYTFSNIKPGTYKIVEVMKVGWVKLTGLTQTITIVAGENRENVDFVNIEYPTIQVIKKVDTNGDGTVDQENATDWEWKLDTATYQTGIAPVENMPGTYTVSETQKPNYHVTSLVCKNGETEIVNTVSESVDITLKSGDKVVCTFTNARNLGQLIVKKVVVNDNGGILQAKDFSFKIDGGTPIQFEEDGQNEYTKYAGLSYNIVEVEADQRGYTTTYDNCSNVTVPYNGTATCTITNTAKAPTLKLVKSVTNDNGGTLTPADWTLTAQNGEDVFNNLGNADTVHTVKAGVGYVLSESEKTGYLPEDWSCNGGTLSSNTITLGLAENVTCTITNNDIAPKLTVIKHVDNEGNDGTKSAGDFPITVTGTNVSKPNFDGSEIGVTVTLNQGEFKVTEIEDTENYTAKYEGCEGTINVGEVKTCTITNTGIDHKPKIEVTKEADKTSVDETGENVTFTFTVKNISKVDTVEILSLVDSEFGNLTGDDDCKVGTKLAPNATCTFNLTELIKGDAIGPDHKNTFIVTVKDEEGNETSDEDDETVEFEDVKPEIEVTKTADPKSIPETGGDVTFTFVVKNTGTEKVILNSLVDDKFGDLNGNGTCITPQELEVGDNYTCTYTVHLSADDLVDHVNVVTATATDNDGTSVTDDDTETVKFEDVEPEIEVTKTADPKSVPETGGDVTFTFVVKNTGTEKVTLNSLVDDKFDNLNGQGTCITPQEIEVGDSYTCIHTVHLSADDLVDHVNVVTATATDNDGTSVTDEDKATVTFEDVEPEIEVTKTADKTSVDETGEEVTFTFTVKNISKENVTIESITDSVFGELNGEHACKVGTTLIPNATCTFTVTRTISGNVGTAHKNIFTTVVKDNDGSTAEDSDDETISFKDVKPSVEVLKTAGVTEIPETGGDVTFTYKVTNTGLEEVTITSLKDDVFGDLTGDDDCKVGTVLAAGESCSFEATFTIPANTPGNPNAPTAHKNIFTAIVKDDEENEVDDEDEEEVKLTPVPSLKLVKKVVHKYNSDESITANDWTLNANGDGGFSYEGDKDEYRFVKAGVEYALSESGAYSGQFEASTWRCTGGELTGSVLKLQAEDDVVCTITNTALPATIKIYKDVVDGSEDIYSNDIFKVKIVDGGEEKEISDTEENPLVAVFEGLDAGTYKPEEVDIPDGYTSLGCKADKTTVGNGETLEFTCTNEVIDPILKIEKSNNAAVTGQKAGDIVEYTITVTAPSDKDPENKYILKNVVVSDIAPAGFKYISGTWTAKKNDVDIEITEPTYNGTDRAQWILGGMKEGDEIVLTYKTQISLRTDPGVYPDIAWVKGVSLSGANVLGNVSTGAETPFVGTEVKVIEDDIVEKGEVLGASITLPNTGASTYLTLGALIMMILGAISLLFKPFKKFKYALLASVVVFGMFLTVLPTKVSAGFLTVKIETPISLTNKATFNIDFTAQDVEERDITVECYKDAVKFASFDKVNAGACPVTVDASGTYKFFVKAIAGADEKQSNEVTVEVNLEKPSPIIDYSKAGNVLKFKTANDGKTAKVEIHRSDKPSYTANDTTKIHTMPVAPNTEYTWTDATAEPGKTYYYALRSLDAFGNVSTMVSDPVVKVSEEVTATTPRTSGTAVAGAETKTEGEVKGDTDEEIMEIKEVKEGKEKVQDGNEGEEKKEELTPSYKKYWYIWVPAILLVLGVGYIYVKRSKEE